MSEEYVPIGDALSDLFASDQLDARTTGIAARIAQFSKRLTDDGVPEATAHSLTLTFGEMAIGDYFGVDIPSSYGVGMIEED